MPCRDYESDSRDSEIALKKQNDRLARIACAAMTELESQGKADFLLLKNDELRAWWGKHKEADRKRMEDEAAKAKLEAFKKAALDKLTDEERAVLGLAPRVKRVKNKFTKPL